MEPNKISSESADADEVIKLGLDLEIPKSFFLYAGAGSGKTRSLVNAIKFACDQYGKELLSFGQQIAVITYTNAACDEIRERLKYSELVKVQTIHSFSWSLLEGYNSDIRKWLQEKLVVDIEDLAVQQSKGRASKASAERARRIERKTKRLDLLGKIRRFVYSASGDNRTHDALNHHEVIAMAAHFLSEKKTFARLLTSKHPILLIDECQDTNKLLMNAFLNVQARYSKAFCLGLFGDTMQRIYTDGKIDLAEEIPDDWLKPEKKVNYRCPERVIELINKIREDEDDHVQVGRPRNSEGLIRLFLAPQSIQDRFEFEKKLRYRMAEFCGDEKWKDEQSVKTLTLEHHMAARRLGFEDFFSPLYRVERLSTPLLQGTLSGLTLFTHKVLPVFDASIQGDQFKVTSIAKKYSPLLAKDNLETVEKQRDILRQTKKAIDSLSELMSLKPEPRIIDVLRNVANSRLFDIPESLYPFTEFKELNAFDEIDDEETSAWAVALEAPISQLRTYDQYSRGLSSFDTHQGVKGREFPRVMVVISDIESKGFMFSYDKLFGAAGKTDADRKNESSGKETSSDRTRKLFYVICSRAEESLSIVYYAASPEIVKRKAIENGWFKPAEIELVGLS